MLERYLIEHCSPTLAGLKTANLIHVPAESDSALRQELCQWNRLLGKKGITLIPLAVKNGKALVYVCRLSRLQRELSESATAAFLNGYGYAGQSAGKAVSTLRRRVCEQDGFPHEIGVFLGYPLKMFSVLSTAGERAANAADAGRSTATSARPASGSSSLKSAGRFIPGCGTAGGRCISSP